MIRIGETDYGRRVIIDCPAQVRVSIPGLWPWSQPRMITVPIERVWLSRPDAEELARCLALWPTRRDR